MAYSLEEFIVDMEAMLKEQPDQEKLFDISTSSAAALTGRFFGFRALRCLFLLVMLHPPGPRDPWGRCCLCCVHFGR